jgi:hypothetical protein
MGDCKSLVDDCNVQVVAAAQALATIGGIHHAVLWPTLILAFVKMALNTQMLMPSNIFAAN